MRCMPTPSSSPEPTPSIRGECAASAGSSRPPRRTSSSLRRSRMSRARASTPVLSQGSRSSKSTIPSSRAGSTPRSARSTSSSRSSHSSCSAPRSSSSPLLVRRDSPGPAFFTQERVGLNGERFHMLKFRSMVVDAEAQLPSLLDRTDGNGVLFKLKSDPRVTRIGSLLRRYSLDELPQLVNVLARGHVARRAPPAARVRGRALRRVDAPTPARASRASRASGRPRAAPTSHGRTACASTSTTSRTGRSPETSSSCIEQSGRSRGPRGLLSRESRPPLRTFCSVRSSRWDAVYAGAS